MVCTVSSDGTVRAWDLQEVSGPEGARISTECPQSHLTMTERWDPHCTNEKFELCSPHARSHLKSELTDCR